MTIIERDNLPGIPYISSLNQSDYSLMLEKIPDAISKQYGISMGWLVDENYKGFSPESILDHAISPIPENTASTCEKILRNVQSWLTPDCIKHVFAGYIFNYRDSRQKTIPLAIFGVNGWNPLILDNKFLDSSEAKTRLVNELIRLGKKKQTKLIKPIIEQMENGIYKTGLSCGQIHQTLTSFGAPDNRPFYCRMGLHQDDKKLRLTNSNCPSSKHCAEGSAAYLKPLAVLLAEIFDINALTVINAQSLNFTQLRVSFTPTLPQDAKKDSIYPWTITIGAGQNEYFGSIIKKTENLLHYRIPQIQLSKTYHDYSLNIATNKFTLFDNTEGNIAYVQDNQFKTEPELQSRQITDSVLISTYTPCALCAVDICNPRQWNIPGLETDPPLVLFERFSRHEEKVDAGDIGPLALLYNRGVNAFRFGLNLPAPELR